MTRHDKYTRASRSRRVLMVLDALRVGGTETHVLALTQSLQQNGYYVVICGNPGHMATLFRRLNCPIYTLDPFGADDDKKHLYRKSLRAIIHRERIGLIHAHQFPSARLALQVARQLRVPVVLTVHGHYYDKFHTRRIAELPQSAVISVSRPVQAWLQADGIASTLIPNGIAVEHFRKIQSTYWRRQLGIPHHALVALYAGRLSMDKADICSSVLRAGLQVRKAHPDFHLVIAGDGTMADEMKKLAHRLNRGVNPPVFHFIGEQLQMRPVYAMADVVIGTGRVAMEAMACEKPVVAVGIEGLIGAVRPSELYNAWRTHFGDHAAHSTQTPNAIAGHVLWLLASSHRRSRYGKAGRRFVLARFGIARIAQATIRVYDQALTEKRFTTIFYPSRWSSRGASLSLSQPAGVTMTKSSMRTPN